MIIAFSGVDGSGKTTQARHAVKVLESRGLNVSYTHIIRWTLVNRIGQLVHRAKGSRSPAGQIGYSHRGYIWMRAFVSILDALRFHVLVKYHGGLKGRSLVCDRFFYDLGVHALYTATMGHRFESVYWHVVPSPTISVLLDVSPEEALRREGDHGLDYYQVKRQLYLDHAPMWGSIIVSAANMADTRQTVTEIITAHLEGESIR